MELQEQFYETQRAQLLRWLPWLHLFRAFRIALDGRKIVLGTLAAFALAAGDSLIDSLPFAPRSSALSLRQASIFGHSAGRLMGDIDDDGAVVLRRSLDFDLSGVMTPYQSIVAPGSMLFRRGNSWADVAYAWTMLLFHLVVWSLLGGAIARIAAVQFARRESITARNAFRYSSSRITSYCGAPLLPLLFIGCFWLIGVLFGLVGRLPGVGTAIAGVLWFIPVLIGLALAVILLVIAVSWPLMVATISTEGTDAFDGLSRGYDYILNRPWYALFLLIATIAYGAIAIWFVSRVCQAGVHLAYWSTAWGMGESHLQELLPLRYVAPPANPALIAPNAPGSIGGTAAIFTLKILSWVVQGFVISFFWTAVTIIYFLLRLSLDARPLDHVHLPAVAAADALPLVGIPAAEQREAASEGTSAGETPDAPPG